MDKRQPYVARDYIDADTKAGKPGGCRAVTLAIDLDPEPKDAPRYYRSRRTLEIEVHRSGSFGGPATASEPFSVCVSGYGALCAEHAAAYADLLGTALDLARRLNENPAAPHGLPSPWHETVALPESEVPAERRKPGFPYAVRSPVFDSAGHLIDLLFTPYLTEDGARIAAEKAVTL